MKTIAMLGTPGCTGRQEFLAALTQAPNDRRIVLIGLTDKGTKVAKDLVSEVQEQLIGLVNHLGEEDSKTLIRLMFKSIEFFASQFEN